MRPKSIRDALVFVARWEAWRGTRPATAELWESFWRGLLAKATPRSCAVMLGLARRYARWQVRQGIVPVEYTADSRAPRTLRPTPKTLSAEALRVLLLPDYPENKRSIRDTTFLHVLWATGARLGEVATMTWDAVHLEAATATVNLKGGGIGQVFLSPLAIEYLTRWKAESLTDDATPGNIWQVGSDRLAQAIQDRARARGVTERVHAHAFRHTYATRLLDAGAGLTDLQALLHHQSIASTAHYIHASPERQRAAVALHPAFQKVAK